MQLPRRKKLADNVIAWYVMRTVACGSYKTIRRRLDADDVEFFQPMHYILRRRLDKPYKSYEPCVSNLFFVRGSREQLVKYTKNASRFQFYYDRTRGIQADCLVIDDKQMEDFKRVYRANAEDPHIFTPSELNIRPGQRIRVIGGPFDGIEGTFQRVQGFRNRRLIVTLDSLLAISTTLTPEFVEVIG